MKIEIKEKKIQKLMNLSIIVILLVVCLIPNKKVNAETVSLQFGSESTPITIAPYGKFFNITNGVVEYATTATNEQFGYYASNFTVTVDGYGGAIGFTLNETLVPNVTYSLTIYLGSDNETMVFQNSVKYNMIALGHSWTNAYDNFNAKEYYNTLHYKSFVPGASKVIDITETTEFTKTANMLTYIFTPTAYNNSVFIPFNAYQTTNTSYTLFYGYNLTNMGVTDNLSSSEIESIISDSGLASASSISEVQESINEVKTELNNVNSSIEEQTQQDKEQHDEFMNSDINEEDKELPDDSKYQDYTDTENSLKDKVSEADMSVISIGIDANSSSWIWDTLTRLIQSNSIIFGMFISILSIGIIKLALGR